MIKFLREGMESINEKGNWKEIMKFYKVFFQLVYKNNRSRNDNMISYKLELVVENLLLSVSKVIVQCEILSS